MRFSAQEPPWLSLPLEVLLTKAKGKTFSLCIPSLYENQTYKVVKLLRFWYAIRANFLFSEYTRRVSYGEGTFGTVSKQLYTVLTSLQMGLIEDNMKWTVNLS